MWKWINWAARMAATALLLSFLSIWTTGYIVNSYIETVLKQLDLPLQSQPFALSGVWGRMWGATPVPNTGEATASAPTPSAQASASESRPNIPVPAGGPGESAGDTAPEPQVSGSPEPAGETTPVPQVSGSPEPTGKDGAIPVFNGNAGILDMTDEQRQMLSAVMSKLNGGQLARLSAILEDGLTEEELKEAGTLLKPSLTESEYGPMMQLLQSRVVKPEASAQPSAEASVQPSAGTAAQPSAEASAAPSVTPSATPSP